MKIFGILAFLSAVVFSGVVTSQVSAEILAGTRLASLPAATQTTMAAQTSSLYNSYRGVTIGLTADQAREKLGAPKEKSNAGDYFVFSASESAQVLYDTDQTVKAISINFMGDLKAAPTPKDVVGMDVKKEADGSINKLVRFPKSGYWVSYIRTGGDDPMIVVTLQKMARE